LVIDTLSEWHTPLMHGGVFVLVGLGVSGIANATTLYIDGQASDDERPACLAVAGFVTGAIGTVLAFVMAGLAHLQGVIWPIWLMVGLNVVAAFSALRLSEVPQRTVALVGADSTS